MYFIDGLIFGSYLHGIFDHAEAYKAILQWAGMTHIDVPDYDKIREAGIDRITDTIEKHVDMTLLMGVMQP